MASDETDVVKGLCDLKSSLQVLEAELPIGIDDEPLYTRMECADLPFDLQSKRRTHLRRYKLQLRIFGELRSSFTPFRKLSADPVCWLCVTVCWDCNYSA